MKCNQQEKIESYHKGELQGEALTFVSQHLENCSECQTHLAELEALESVLTKVKEFQPELANPGAFRNEILEKVRPKQQGSFIHGLSMLLDHLISLLVHPVTRYSFISAAVIIFGVFIYQQTIIVQKIGSLEKRMETSVKDKDSNPVNRKGVEAFFKKRSGIKTGDMEFNELLEDYRLLLLKQRVLLKALQEKYPDTYKDILKELEKAEMLPENVNI